MTTVGHFTTTLPTKRIAADCLVFGPGDRFLLVQPVCEPTWDIPGGVAEVDESPRRAARREVLEELGLDLQPGALLAVDWVPRAGQFTEVVAFVFDGGTIDVWACDLTLQPQEIGAARFSTLAEAEQLMDAEAHARVAGALAARDQSSAIYLEGGLPSAIPGAGRLV